MVVELIVENIAIIERSQILLGPGLTVLTGETGAGKSLLVDAIELALGERADSELVRAGSPKASVSVVFDLSANPDLASRCANLGLDLEDGALFVQREVFAEGRSQCRIGGRPTPVSTLRQLGQYLVDLHGQHDHQSLLDSDRHIGYLDSWIGAPADDLSVKLRDAFGKAEELRKRLAAIRTGLRDREQKINLLNYQINEIESVAPKLGELDEQEIQLSRLKNVEKLAAASFGGLAQLADDEGCAADRLALSLKSLEDAVRFDVSLEQIIEPLRAALYQLEEATRALRAYSEQMEADPARLEEVAARIDALKRLRRKYGDDERSILAFLAQAREDLELLGDSEASEADLVEALEAATEGLNLLAGTLTELRKAKAEEFGQLVQLQLRDLAMDRALFEVSVTAKTVDSSGTDKVDFSFSANAGEPARPLVRIASGGEVSRVMLAIKTALAGRAGVPTLIFDEIDAGLGGRVAAVVAKKLEELATHYQVVVISHLPQIASRASAHYRIEKAESKGRIVTQVRLLNPEERVGEIARMLAGEQITDSALATARELLGGAGEPRALF